MPVFRHNAIQIYNALWTPHVENQYPNKNKNICNSQWLPREVKLGDAPQGDHQRHRRHCPPQSKTYKSSKFIWWDSCQREYEKKNTNMLYSIVCVPMRFHHIVNHDSLKGRGIFNDDKADQMLQSTEKQNSGWLLYSADLPSSPQLHQEFCGNKPDHQHLQQKC